MRKKAKTIIKSNKSDIHSKRKLIGRTLRSIAIPIFAVILTASIVLGLGPGDYSAAALKTQASLISIPPPSPIGRGCQHSVSLSQNYNPDCTWSVENPIGTIILFGDSNAVMYATPVIEVGNALGYNVTVDGASSCPYIGLREMRKTGELHTCPNFGNKSINFMIQAKPSLVVLVARSDFYLQNPKDGFAKVGNNNFVFNNPNKAKLYQWAMHRTLVRLGEAGVPVVVIHPVPVLPIDPDTCRIIRSWTHSCATSLSRMAVNRWLHLSWQIEKQAAAGLGNVVSLGFENQLCGPKRCSTTKDGIPLYHNDRHLGYAGAKMLIPEFEQAFKAKAVERPPVF